MWAVGARVVNSEVGTVVPKLFQRNMSTFILLKGEEADTYKIGLALQVIANQEAGCSLSEKTADCEEAEKTSKDKTAKCPCAQWGKELLVTTYPEARQFIQGKTPSEMARAGRLIANSVLAKKV